jgi:hypothetical protein
MALCLSVALIPGGEDLLEIWGAGFLKSGRTESSGHFKASDLLANMSGMARGAFWYSQLATLDQAAGKPQLPFVSRQTEQGKSRLNNKNTACFISFL